MNPGRVTNLRDTIEIATRAHQDVEAEAAAFFNSEAALYVAGGYYFGLIAISAVSHEFGAIFFDELAHHALREGIVASGLSNWAFRHLDPEDLEGQLKRHLPANAKPLVVTDGMFSTFGEIAPLQDFAHVMASYDGTLLVDESHSFGVLGTLGRGAGEHHDISAASILMGGSTSKALGVMGGIIPASANHVAAYRSTPAGRGAAAGLPAAAAMCSASLKFVRQHPELLQRLRANIAYLKSGLREIGLPVADNLAPVATFQTESQQSMQSLQELLHVRRDFRSSFQLYWHGRDRGSFAAAFSRITPPKTWIVSSKPCGDWFEHGVHADRGIGTANASGRSSC